jgi:hypothetical protein
LTGLFDVGLGIYVFTEDDPPASYGAYLTYEVSYSIDGAASWLSLGTESFLMTDNPDTEADDFFSAGFDLNLQDPAVGDEFWVMIDALDVDPEPYSGFEPTAGVLANGASLGLNAVPLPGAVWLLGAGLLGLIGLRRKTA